MASAWIRRSRNSQTVFGIRHAIRQPQTKEAHEGQAVVNQVFRPLLGQIVQHLDDQNSEHQHWIKRQATALASV